MKNKIIIILLLSPFFQISAQDKKYAISIVDTLTSQSMHGRGYVNDGNRIAADFIKKEVLGKMGIRNYAWQDDISSLPKSAAGSSIRSRDMMKWGLLVMNNGKWNGEQLISAEFVEKATSKIHTNKQGTSYGYFWWRHEVTIAGKEYICKTGRGAGGQFIFMFPELDLVAVVTSHNKGMGPMLKAAPDRIVPAFAK